MEHTDVHASLTRLHMTSITRLPHLIIEKIGVCVTLVPPTLGRLSVVQQPVHTREEQIMSTGESERGRERGREVEPNPLLSWPRCPESLLFISLCRKRISETIQDMAGATHKGPCVHTIDVYSTRLWDEQTLPGNS